MLATDRADSHKEFWAVSDAMTSPKTILAFCAQSVFFFFMNRMKFLSVLVGLASRVLRAVQGPLPIDY